MPLKDLFGSLDSLTGGVLSDAVSNIANQTSLDETIGSFVSGAGDLGSQAQGVETYASDAATSAVDVIQGDFAGMAQEATTNVTAEVETMVQDAATDFSGVAQDTVAGFEGTAQDSVDQIQDGLNGVVGGVQGSLGDLKINELANNLGDAIPGSVGDILGGLFNR